MKYSIKTRVRVIPGGEEGRDTVSKAEQLYSGPWFMLRGTSQLGGVLYEPPVLTPRPGSLVQLRISPCAQTECTHYH